MALVQVVDIASGEVVAEYQVPPTEQISLEPGQELVFADVEYGPLDATEPAVTFQEITDEDDEAADIQITLADGSVLLVENLGLLLEDGEDVGIRFADAAEFATLQDFVFTAGGGTAGGPGGGLALGGGRGNDGSINPLDLNVPHIRALGVEGEIPRPAFADEDEIEPDNPDEEGGEDLPTLSIDDVTVTEPSFESQQSESEEVASVVARFTVTLSAPSAVEVTVDFSTVDATAESGGSPFDGTADYEPTSGTLIFAPGVTSQTIDVVVYGDFEFEVTELFNVVLSDAVGASIADETGVGTILDTTVPPTPEDDPANPDNETNTVWEGADDTGNDPNFVVSQTSGNIMDNDDLGTEALAALPVVNVTLQTSYAHSSSTNSGVQTISSDDGAWSIEIDLSNGDYTFTLNGPVDQDALGDGNIAGLEFQYQLETISGVESATVVLGIAIVDDTPMAYGDLDVLPEGEGSSVSGNVIDGVVQSNDGEGTADYLGGDDAGDDTVVTFVSGSNGSGGAGASVGGTYGSVTIAADGSYTYTSFTQSVPTGATDEFTYTVTDDDGDTSSATLTIEFTDANEPTAQESSQEVDEAGLDAADVAGNSGGGTPVTINFDGLSSLDVVTNQFAGVTFSTDTTDNWLAVSTPSATSLPLVVTLADSGNIPANGSSGNIEFTSPANNLTLNVVSDNFAGTVATIDVYEDGVLADSVDVIGDANGSTPVAVDLSAYTNVTCPSSNDLRQQAA